MIAAGECVYCHTMLAGPSAPPPPPRVIHVTKVELHGAGDGAGRVFDSVTARLAGCFSGCLSAAVTLGIMAIVMGFVAWQMYVEARNLPQPAPAPAPAPAADHPRRRR